jgi:hypothetical protein
MQVTDVAVSSHTSKSNDFFHGRHRTRDDPGRRLQQSQVMTEQGDLVPEIAEADTRLVTATTTVHREGYRVMRDRLQLAALLRAHDV